MKSIICCAILTLPAAHGAPRQLPTNSATSVPPKARVVAAHPKKTKLHVSVLGEAAADKSKAIQAAKTSVPKVVAARPIPSNRWYWFPKFQKSGKEDTTYGFMLKRRF